MKTAKIKVLFNQGFLTLEDIEKTVIQKGGFCVNGTCHKKIRPGSIRSYPHDEGRIIKDKELKEWVFFECSCGYQSSLWKVENRIGHKFRG